MTDEQKKKLEQKLWDIANELRGRMDADEFRDYILGFIFYKYLSERLHLYVDQELLAAEGLTFATLDETAQADVLAAVRDACVEALGYYLSPAELFSAVAQRGAQPGGFILQDLADTLDNIQKSTMGNESEEDFINLFEDLDLNSSKLGRTNEARNALISKVLGHLDAIDFQLGNTDSDVLGDAYEYLIGKFASGAGKKAGEFYTPQQVSTVLAKIVTTGKKRLRSVYDPTCGSASLLLRVARELNYSNANKTVGDFFGQELNRTTYNLARMNMILHGVHYSSFDIAQEDTLEHPQHIGRTFEAIVANPPFSAKWSAAKIFESDDRFAEFGRIAPASKADFAFVQHMVHHLDEDGTMAVILPHGVLFRGGAEGDIRRFLIERNWLDAVIGLPANIFYGTTIPTCILVCKKCKEADDVLFVDASGCFEKGKNQNSLGAGDVSRIVAAYRDRAEEPRFAHRATRAEIAENDFNLNIPRYVDTFEPEPQVDLEALTHDAVALGEIVEMIDAHLLEIGSALGIEIPTVSNVELLTEYKRGLMQRLFSRELRFRRDDGSAFPDWQERRLGDVFGWVRTNSLSREYLTEDPGSGIQNIHYGDIHGKFRALFLQSHEEVPFLTHDAPIKKLKVEEFLCVGDVVIADASEDYADIGKAIEIIEVAPKSLIAGLHTLVARPRDGALVPGFSGYLLRTEAMRKQVMRIAQGISVLGVSKGNLEKLTLSLPHPDEQRKIAAALSALDAKIDATARKISELGAFKKGLLQKLFV